MNRRTRENKIHRQDETKSNIPVPRHHQLRRPRTRRKKPHRRDEEKSTVPGGETRTRAPPPRIRLGKRHHAHHRSTKPQAIKQNQASAHPATRRSGIWGRGDEAYRDTAREMGSEEEPGEASAARPRGGGGRRAGGEGGFAGGDGGAGRGFGFAAAPCVPNASTE
jgi:hypothetical protein